VLLETLRGELSVPEACRRLGIGESRFQDLRGEWLQEALELLEPRPLGRPPRAADPAQLQARIRALESENRTLRQQLTAAEVRRELAEVLPQLVHAPEEAVKKGASVPPPPPLRRPR
jgi:transposase